MLRLHTNRCVIRPHRKHRTEAAFCYTYRTLRGLCACRCAGQTGEPCKNGWTHRMEADSFELKETTYEEKQHAAWSNGWNKAMRTAIRIAVISKHTRLNRTNKTKTEWSWTDKTRRVTVTSSQWITDHWVKALPWQIYACSVYLSTWCTELKLPSTASPGGG